MPKLNQLTSNSKSSHNTQGSLGPSIEKIKKLIDHMQAIIGQRQLGSQQQNQHAYQGIQHAPQYQTH